MLFDLGLIKRNVLCTNYLCNTWQDAIMKGASLLQNTKAIQKTYGQKIIQNFEKMGPYMVIAPNIVLSHARPSDGVLRNGISFLTLENKIKFGNKENDPVGLIITLAGEDNFKYTKILSELINLLRDKEGLQKIMESKNEDELFNILKKY